ncbi:MAG: superoxide dismutase family protein [Spirosomaceae bacterium]|nr:superoxide dismutase family protein [Spirosomataceae bacterium]
MKKITLSLAVICSTLILSCNNAETTEETSTEEMTEEVAEMKTVNVAMLAKSESTLQGNVMFTEEGNEVTMKVDISGVTPGEHAIHIHQTPDCSSADGKSAGGHWNPAMEDHGKWGEMDHHAGDIGNLVADAEGKATLTFSTDKWCIGCEDSTKNILNRAIIIHADVDDFKTQPTGNAGGRIGCGVIQ